MGYNLFLDDVRTVEMVWEKVPAPGFVIIRSYNDFVACIKKWGLPDLISFDNDLGLDANGDVAPDGYAAAKWLVYESGLDLRQLRFHVHSANPVAAGQINSLLNNYIQFLKDHGHE